MEKVARRTWNPVLVRTLRIALTTVVLIVLVVFFGVLAYVTLTPLPHAVGQATGNTDPGSSIKFYLDRPNIREAIQELGGNLLLLAPLGALLPLLGGRMRNWFVVTLTCAVVSLVIETVQGVFLVGRAFDIDDVILNTAGALLAYLLVGRRLARVLRPRRRRRA
jgi:glycopeptide antibiotics resistance protein